eukprot:10292154-Alexandrium_andersonii.AAC.1
MAPTPKFGPVRMPAFSMDTLVPVGYADAVMDARSRLSDSQNVCLSPPLLFQHLSTTQLISMP